MSNSVGKKLKALRSPRMSQDEMAALSGIPRTTIQRIEGGRSHDFRDIEAICKVLGISPSVLWDAKPIGAIALSPSAIPGPLSVGDCVVILAQLERVSPDRRAIALAWLFDAEDLLPEDRAADLAVFFHESEKSS